jgi:hypothetical protein
VHITKGTIYYDLVTTCHSFIANGIAVNNCENNDGLAGERVWPYPIITPKTLGFPEHEMAEEYYDRLPRRSSDSGGSPADGSGAGRGDEPALKASGPGAGHCGGAAGNPVEVPGLETVEGHSAYDLEIARRHVARELIEHASKHPGTVPGNLKLWADQKLEPPKIDWRKQFAQNIRSAIRSKAGASDYTYRRMSRRQTALNRIGTRRAPILPGLHQPIPKVVVALDTSGSMMGVPLEQAFSEAMGVVRALGAPCEAIAVDAAVQGAVMLKGVGDLKRLAQGGGGTDMRLALREAAMRKPDVIVLLTDGYTSWLTADEAARLPRTVVGIVGGGAAPPPYLRCVTIPNTN